MRMILVYGYVKVELYCIRSHCKGQTVSLLLLIPHSIIIYQRVLPSICSS